MQQYEWGRVAVIVEGGRDDGIEKKAERRKKMDAGSFHALREKVLLFWKEGFTGTF